MSIFAADSSNQKNPFALQRVAASSATTEPVPQSPLAGLGASGKVDSKQAAQILDHYAEPGPSEIARQGLHGGAQRLPHLDRIQTSFGQHDVSGVRSFVGGPAARASRQLGALAYATGDSVAFRDEPDLHTAAHEAAHVVQQRAGVQLKDGMGRAGDAYEQHADAVADRVVQGKSAGDLLDRHVGAGASGGSAVQLQDVAEEAPRGTIYHHYGTEAPLELRVRIRGGLELTVGERGILEGSNIVFTVIEASAGDVRVRTTASWAEIASNSGASIVFGGAAMTGAAVNQAREAVGNAAENARFEADTLGPNPDPDHGACDE